ncbi:hypothetical protein [Aliarcobacter cryaerophilus]|uniref:hypothetical protein n=1 Tax=Aliarcobacter cryaerophilus TaxID=28198 RepID=UPI00112F1571|nr:hypothetical protein [Aliarcobacter cryaerophilus]
MTFEDFLISTLSGGIIGGLASYVASRQFQKVNSNKNKPQIEVSNQLIEAVRFGEQDKKVIQIKLLNKTDQDLSDIRIELEGFKNLAPEGSIPLLLLTRITKREILSIKKYDKKDDIHFHNAHRINLFVDNGDIIEEIGKFESIRISIHANCPFYNTSAIISKDYKVKTCLLDKNHTFNTGNNLSIQRIN